MDKDLATLAETTMDYALKQGAGQAAVAVYRGKFIELKRREGKVETLQASTTRGLSIALYVDGRYSSNSTTFLGQDQVRRFVDEALVMTRHLVADPYRALPDPELYGKTTGIELELSDPGYENLAMDRRLQLVAEAELAAQAAGGKELISVTAELTTSSGQSLKLHSNGFRGERSGTRYQLAVSATARDQGERRPEDYWAQSARHLADLGEPAAVGQEASRRALARIGGRKVQSKRMALLVENRAAGRLVGSLLEPLSGSALQQRRSCFEDKAGEQLGSALLTLRDEPLIVRGLGTRTFDDDGLAARALPLLGGGRLENYLIDVYYGRKLGRQPTTGSTSNLIFATGEQSLTELIAAVPEGILVTGFLGGNSNPATGDFSFGIHGFSIQGGKLDGPVSEMNITDNQTRLWQRLSAVGNDPYRYSSWQMPSLLFSDVQFSGL